MEPAFVSGNARVYQGDCVSVLLTMPDASVNCCVTSPPYYGLRDYGHDGQIGLEPTPDAYVARLVEVFREVRRVMNDDGTLWLNLGDSYSFSGKGGNPEESQHRKQATNAGSLIKGGDMGSGLPPKNLLGIPWRVAFALQADGWYLRQDIIWHKPNPMPESVRDRCTKAHEYVFLMSKSANYFYDADAVKEESTGKGGGASFGKQKIDASGTMAQQRTYDRPQYTHRNRRSVWTITTKPYKGAHFATMPPKLVEPCVLAGCPAGGTVLDPFSGSGTTGMVAVQHGRKYVGIELNPEYIALSAKRIEPSLMGEMGGA